LTELETDFSPSVRLSVNLKAALRTLEEVVHLCDVIDSGVDLTKENTNVLKESLTKAHSALGQTFGPLKMIRKDLFALQSSNPN